MRADASLSGLAFGFGLASVLLAACPPTLSQPRGETHLAALARGNELVRARDFDAAAIAYDEAARSAERRVDRDEAAYLRARALRRAGREEEALEVLDQIAAAEPVSRNTVRALFDASVLRLRGGDREAGRAGLLRVVREHPDHGNARRALLFLLRDDEADEAGEAGDRANALLAELEPALRETELHDDILYAMGKRAETDGDDEGARAAYRRIVAEHPYPQGEYWDDALLRLATLAEAVGELEEAIRYLEELTARHEGTWSPGTYTLPTMPGAQLRIAELQRDGREDLGAAEDAFQTLYDDYPTSTLRDDALLGVGDVAERRGDHEAACAIYRRVVEEFEVGSARREATRRLGDC